jgi:hypothetical protein
MRSASKVFSTVVAALGLAVFPPVSARAGTITIVDGANDIVSFTTDGAATTARLTTTGCAAGSEASSCFFSIIGPTGSVSPVTIDHLNVSLIEPGQTFSSDNLHNTDTGAQGSSFWQFASDGETGLTVLPTAFTLTENGTAQSVVTLTYHSVTGSILGTDTIQIQSDLDPVPEPTSASLLALGGGLLLAAGRLRKRVRG